MEDDGDYLEPNYAYSIGLRADHPSKDLDCVTIALGLRPKNCWKAGDFWRAPYGPITKRRNKTSYWQLSEKFYGSRRFSEGLEKYLSVLEKNAEFVNQFVSDSGAFRLDIALPGSINIGDILRWPLLQRFASIKIDLGIEVFSEMLLEKPEL